MGEDKYAIMEIATGEQIAVVKDNQSITIKNNDLSEYEQLHDMDFKKDCAFAKIYMDAIPILTEKLQPTEINFVYAILPYILWENCILGEVKGRYTHYYSLEELSKKLNLPYNTTRRIFGSLKRKGIVGSHQTGTIIPEYMGATNTVYTVNPFVFFKGKYPSKVIVKFYEKTGWDKLLTSTTGKNIDELNSENDR